jgi:hypothetical protein
MTPSMLQVAKCQDIIGWKLFLKGRITKKIRLLQTFQCSASPCQMNGAEWVKHFFSRLLHISHGQWVLRNFTLHNQTRGYLRLQERQQVLEEMDPLAEADPANIPQESQFLLEMDFSSLLCSFFERQSYWVMVMKAARRVGRRTVVHQSRRGALDQRLDLRIRMTRPKVNTDTARRWPHPASMEATLASNKCLKKARLRGVSTLVQYTR